MIRPEEFASDASVTARNGGCMFLDKDASDAYNGVIDCTA